MVGLIAPNGGLSEWARILQQVSAMDCSPDRDENPFLLSPAERTFFLHLFFYHDQVLPMLVRALAQLPAYTRIGVRDACLMMVECLGEFFNEIQGSGVERVQVSGQLRNLLGRIAAQYMLSDLKTFLVPENRSAALVEIKCRQKVRRVHLAEYHAICRFEQLTDMGLLTKDGRDDGVETGDARRAWEWYVTPPLGRLVNTIPDTLNLETFFEQHWIHFSAQMIGLKLKRTDPFESQIEVARVLDETLPLVRRQLGPVQVHSWAVLTCLRAMKAGMHLEIGDVYQLLDAIRSDPKASNVVRQGGRAQLLGRTAAVVQGKISHFLEASPVRKESTK
jgi:hypothetical protein